MNRFFSFLIKRFALIPVALLAITLTLYGIVMLMPLETRVSLYMPESNSNVPGWQERMREKIIERHHLQEPFPVQYAYWLGSLVKGDWGYSPILNNDVLPLLLRRALVTIELILYALLFQIPLGLLAGVSAAQKKDRFQDQSLMTIDGFLNNRADISLDAMRHLVLPVFTLSFAHWALLARITRAQLLEEMQKEYITAAYARGLDEKKVIWQHAFRNTLGPALNSSAVTAATLVTSVYVVERIFNLKGVSELITRYGPMVPDAAAVLGFSVFSTLLVLALMLILDILQAALLPLIKEEAFYNEKS